MSWDKFRENVKQFANQAADEINQSADYASLQIKLNVAQKRAEKAYAVLGKLAYRRFSDEEISNSDWERATTDIELVNGEIDKLRAQIDAIKADIDAARANREAKRAEKNAESQSNKNE